MIAAPGVLAVAAVCMGYSSHFGARSAFQGWCARRAGSRGARPVIVQSDGRQTGIGSTRSVRWFSSVCRRSRPAWKGLTYRPGRSRRGIVLSELPVRAALPGWRPSRRPPSVVGAPGMSAGTGRFPNSHSRASWIRSAQPERERYSPVTADRAAAHRAAELAVEVEKPGRVIARLPGGRSARSSTPLTRWPTKGGARPSQAQPGASCFRRPLGRGSSGSPVWRHPARHVRRGTSCAACSTRTRSSMNSRMTARRSSRGRTTIAAARTGGVPSMATTAGRPSFSSSPIAGPGSTVTAEPCPCRPPASSRQGLGLDVHAQPGTRLESAALRRLS